MNTFETREDIVRYLIEESDGQYTQAELDPMSNRDLLDLYLQWEGIVNYADEILSAVRALGLAEPEGPIPYEDYMDEMESDINYLVGLLDERQLARFNNWKTRKMMEAVDLRGKLVLQVWEGGRWINTDWSENTKDGYKALESRFNEFDTPYVRIQQFF